MKITRPLVLALAFGSFTGCATLSQESAAPASQTAALLAINVPSAPPEAPAEVQTQSPGPGHIWVAGYHDFIGGRHVWRAGRWVEVKSGYEYVRAKYEWTGQTWVFHVPHWKKRHAEQANANLAKNP
jgi:hypothetical protein